MGPRPSRRLPTNRTLTTATLVALLTCPSWAAATRCSNEGVTRGVEVMYSDPGQAVPCEVIYDKSGESGGQHSLWRANNEAGYCEAQAAALLDKLRSLGWSCGAAPNPIQNSAAIQHSAVMQPGVTKAAPGAREPSPTELLGETIE